MLYLFEHPEAVNSISLQPGANGNFFASASKDGILRLFDTRRNKTGELDILKHPSSFFIRLIQIKFLSLSDAVLQPDTELGKLFTAMFSPTEPSVIAVVGSDYGTVLYDIRNIKRLVQLFCKPLAIFYLRFNRGIIYVFQSILLFSEPE